MIRSASGGLAAILIALGVVGLSHIPYAAETADHGVLRLAWRARGVRVEECRDVSPEERARTPAHMQREQVCVGRVLPYRLQVLLDRTTVLRDTVQPAGARADRPLYVYRELRVTPGSHQVRVEFLRDALPDSLERSRDLTPVRLVFDDRLTIAAGEIALLTYDADRRRLHLRGYGQRP